MVFSCQCFVCSAVACAFPFKTEPSATATHTKICQSIIQTIVPQVNCTVHLFDPLRKTNPYEIASNTSPNEVSPVVEHSPIDKNRHTIAKRQAVRTDIIQPPRKLKHPSVVSIIGHPKAMLGFSYRFSLLERSLIGGVPRGV